MKLVGDIGGTKVLLALVDTDGALIEVRRLASADFSSFDDLLAAYLNDVAAPFDGGCLAVAGPLAGDGRSAKITNLPWRIDAPALEARYRLGHLRLVNDFAAVAAGVAALPADRLQTLQAGEPVAGSLQLAIGAGTGLGVAALASGTILASEGGHVGFAPANELQDAFTAWLRREHERATAERAISGMGLVNLYRFLATRERPDDPDPLAAADPAASIGELALADAGSLSRRAALEFFACYGAFAGDMALAFMARGGVYLAGGVTQKLQPLLARSAFLASFNAKAEHAALAQQMPVYLVTDPEVGLAGAAVLARPTDS